METKCALKTMTAGLPNDIDNTSHIATSTVKYQLGGKPVI